MKWNEMYFIYQDLMTIIKYISSQKCFVVNEVNSFWGKNFVWLSTIYLSSGYSIEFTVFLWKKTFPIILKANIIK